MGPRAQAQGTRMRDILASTRNTCTQQHLARLPNLFSVITVILLINMPIPSKFDSCKIFATNLNAANSLGLGSKKRSKHLITLKNNYRFLIIFFCKY